MNIKQLEIGDIGFSFSKNNLFSRLIFYISNWRTKTLTPREKVSHCFIYMGDGLIAESSFSGVAIVNLKKYLNNEHYLEFKRLKNPLSDEQKNSIWLYACESAGLVKYSYGQLFFLLLGKIFNFKVGDYSKGQMVCSEFVSYSYEEVSINLTSQESYDNTPLDIYSSEKVSSI